MGLLMTVQQQHIIEGAIQKERQSLLNFINSRIPRSVDGEDILHDVWMQLLVSIDSIHSIERVQSWLYTVARNKITDMYRKMKPVLLEDQRNINPYSEGDKSLMLEDILPAFGNTPEDEYFRSLISEKLDIALNELPSEQHDVFVMHEFDDMSFKEIAAATGIGVNTLISRKRYAILYLREQLTEMYNELNT
ncbi:MAG: sigma-70 family RNA polymerase sigma factor [Bacteroidales bacterium]|nr:sigma-70 family RNA polymerase sigma factor [Bacteroidales bacterium]MCF8456406.1 sigma-70 family RNA polymerase sigma factor [Bacteroidales bacterium]